MRSRGRATVGRVSLLVHVEAMRALRESVDHAGDGDRPIRHGLDDFQVTGDVPRVDIVRRQTNDRHHLLIESIRHNQYRLPATW